MVRRLETNILVAVLVRGVTGQDGGDVEDDGCFLICERVLGGRFVCKGVEPVRR